MKHAICAICKKEIKESDDLVKSKLPTIKKRLYYHAICYFGSIACVFDPNVKFDYRLDFFKKTYESNNIGKKHDKQDFEEKPNCVICEKPFELSKSHFWDVFYLCGKCENKLEDSTKCPNCKMSFSQLMESKFKDTSAFKRHIVECNKLFIRK